MGTDVNTNWDLSDDGYVFATGRSNRYYDLLVDVMKGLPYKLIIACDNYELRAKYENIIVLSNCYKDDMLKLMAKSHCVAIPLKDSDISSGQLVAIQAMALGKPIICSNFAGIKDYVVDEETGFVINNNCDEWTKALDLIYSVNINYEKMSKKACLLYKTQFTADSMYKRIAEIVK